MKTFSNLLLTVFLGTSASLFAQNEVLLNGQEKAYPQKYMSRNLTNYQNDCYFLTKKGVQNLLGGKLLFSKKVENLCVSPKGDAYVVINKSGKDKVVTIYNLWKQEKKAGTIKLKKPVVSACFSADGSRLYLADTAGKLNIYNCANQKLIGEMTFDMQFKEMIASSDGHYLAATDGNDVFVVDLRVSISNVRKRITTNERVNAFDFSDDSQELAVLCSNGVLTIFDTFDFSQKHQVGALGDARDCDYHPQGKYVSVITGDARIALINLINQDERMYVDAAGTGVTDVLFCKDSRGGIYMIYNTNDAIHYKIMNELPPYLTKMLDEEVKLRMEQWEKRMPEETLEEYAMRVNDDTRQMQMRLFEEEIATRMAMDMGGAKLMALENYNPETNMMSLDMGDMPDIYIQVPREEVAYFMNTDDLEIRNAIYGIDKNDKIEMVYADVYNKRTGKTYTFNNRERQSLEYLTSDDRFIPLEYVQQSAMDEMKLDEMKQKIVTAAMESKSISEHTNISVSTNTLSKVDEDGVKHVDYQVSFGYTVDAEFSEREDFAPGKYKAEHSAAAQAMLNIINTAMQTEFASYTGAGKKVKVSITGSADAIPIKRAIAYDGVYGEFENEPVFKNGELTSVSISKAAGITTNEQLAFLRASGMKESVSTNVSALQNMDVDYEMHIEQAEGVGGQYRRIHVDFTFYDAF